MRRSPFQFSGMGGSSPQLFLALGFAVLDGPTLPIVAEGEEEPNDSYVQQLTAGARAAVEVGTSHCDGQSDGRKLKSTQRCQESSWQPHDLSDSGTSQADRLHGCDAHETGGCHRKLVQAFDLPSAADSALKSRREAVDRAMQQQSLAESSPPHQPQSGHVAACRKS